MAFLQQPNSARFERAGFQPTIANAAVRFPGLQCGEGCSHDHDHKHEHGEKRAWNGEGDGDPGPAKKVKEIVKVTATRHDSQVNSWAMWVSLDVR